MVKDSIIKLKNFSFSYDGENEILSNISLNIKEGERILILGPSGCGKSTLTLCLNGIIPQLIDGTTKGKIEVKNMDVFDTPVSILSQHVGIVFQDPESQFCMLKVEDEVAFGLENLMLSRQKIKYKINTSLKKVNLFSYKDWLINSLSGGMKQRLALASLLALDQKILIFDEPTSNLDPLGTKEVSEIVRKLPLSKTLIIIEHKLDEFIDIFDKILLLNKNGMVIAFDSVKNIFLNYYRYFKEMGVWIPQIPKFVYKLHKNNINTFDFPLNKKEVKESMYNIEKSDKKQKIFHILKEELRKNIYNFDRLIDSSIKIKANDLKQKTHKTVFGKKFLIKIENLNYKFSQSSQLVLEDINFSIERGDFMGIVGHNGSGKTTLAKLIVSLYRAAPPSKITIYNPNTSDLRKAKQDEILDFTGFVFQNPEHQFLEDSVYKEISYGLKIKYRNEYYTKEKTEKILEIMNLEDLKDKNPFNLSQGQKRKLSVASILAMDHEIIILDEPTFGLDYTATTSLMELLEELNKNGKTIIIITHDMNIIFKYTHKVLVLNKGKSVFFGNTYNLLKEKEIINSSNLLIPPLYELYKDVSEYALL